MNFFSSYESGRVGGGISTLPPFLIGIGKFTGSFKTLIPYWVSMLKLESTLPVKLKLDLTEAKFFPIFCRLSIMLGKPQKSYFFEWPGHLGNTTLPPRT